MKITTAGLPRNQAQAILRLAFLKPGMRIIGNDLHFPVTEIKTVVSEGVLTDFSHFDFGGEIDYTFDGSTFTFDLTAYGCKVSGKMSLASLAMWLDGDVEGVVPGSHGKRIYVNVYGEELNGQDTLRRVEVNTADYLSDVLDEKLAFTFAAIYCATFPNKLKIETKTISKTARLPKPLALAA